MIGVNGDLRLRLQIIGSMVLILLLAFVRVVTVALPYWLLLFPA